MNQNKNTMNNIEPGQEHLEQDDKHKKKKKKRKNK
jgi:hypothetical protein